MKRLNEKDLEIIRSALASDIEGCYDHAYLEYKRNNIKRAEEIEEYAEEVKKVLRKLS